MKATPIQGTGAAEANSVNVSYSDLTADGVAQ